MKKSNLFLFIVLLCFVTQPVLACSDFERAMTDLETTLPPTPPTPSSNDE